MNVYVEEYLKNHNDTQDGFYDDFLKKFKEITGRDFEALDEDTQIFAIQLFDLGLQSRIDKSS